MVSAIFPEMRWRYGRLSLSVGRGAAVWKRPLLLLCEQHETSSKFEAISLVSLQDINTWNAGTTFDLVGRARAGHPPSLPFLHANLDRGGRPIKVHCRRRRRAYMVTQNGKRGKRKEECNILLNHYIFNGYRPKLTV